MATTTEDVVVRLKVEPSNFDKTIETLDKTTKAFSSAEKSVTAFDKALQAVGKVLETGGKLLGGLTNLGKALVETVTWFKENIIGVGLFTGAVGTKSKVMQSSAKFLVGKYIPVLGQVLAIYQALETATKIWGDAIARNSEITENNAKIAGATSLIYTKFLDDLIVPLTGAWNNMTTALKENILTWGPMNSLGQAALLIAEGQVEAYKELDKLTLKQIKSTNIYAGQIQNLNNLLTNKNLTDDERLELMKELRDVQIKALQVDREVQQQRVIALGFSAAAATDLKEKAELIKQEAIEKQKLGAIDLQISQAFATYEQEKISLLEKEKKKKEIIIVLTKNMLDVELERLALYDSINFDEFTKKQEDWWDAQVEGAMLVGKAYDIALDDVEEFAENEEIALDKLTAVQEKAARDRIAWQQFGAEGVLGIAANAFGSMASLAQENFELQKAFATGEAVINTAGAIVRASRVPGFPIAAALIPAIALAGAAQIAQINAAQPGTGSIVNPTYTTSAPTSPLPIESASRDFYSPLNANTKPQVVLVTEDLNTVQARVAVTESRASIG